MISKVYQDMDTNSKLVLNNILIALVVFALGRASYFLTSHLNVIVFPIYLPAGFTYVFIHKKHKLNIVGITVGNLFESGFNIFAIYEEITFVHLLTILMITFANTIQPFTASILVTRYTREANSFHNPRALSIFVFSSAFACLLAGFIGASSLLLANLIPISAYLGSVTSWWLSDLAAMIVISPILLNLSSTYFSRSSTKYLAEISIFALMMVAYQYLFLLDITLIEPAYHFEYIVIPFMIWSVIRFSPLIAMLHIFSVSLSSLLGTFLGTSVFSDINPNLDMSLLMTQRFLLIIGIANLYFVAMVTEREEYALVLEQRVKEAVSELKILTGLLPICSQCKKIRNDQDEWVPLETYMNKHSEVKFSHGYCVDCMNDILDKV